MLRHLAKRILGRDEDRIDGVLPRDEFLRVLDHQRALADRHGSTFAVLIFSPHESTPKGALAPVLAKILSQRVRGTDVLGLLDKQRVGALLTLSDQAGAARVAEHACSSVAGSFSRPTCEVYTYPCQRVRIDEATERNAAGQSGPSHTHSAALERTATGYVCAHDCKSPANCRVMKLLVAPTPVWKRALDIFISAIALALLSPLFLCVAIFIRLVSPGPALFKQERVGFMGQVFCCWKFRTMHLNADTGAHREHLQKLISSNAPMKKLDTEDDPRIIPCGVFLRSTGIDELPQLFNVLRGEMSLVGPRPCIQYEYDRFEPWHKRRFDTLPGLTGLWQVNGKNKWPFRDMMRFDVRYAHKRSLTEDIRIMLRTAPAVADQVKDIIAARRTKHGQENT